MATDKEAKNIPVIFGRFVDDDIFMDSYFVKEQEMAHITKSQAETFMHTVAGSEKPKNCCSENIQVRYKVDEWVRPKNTKEYSYTDKGKLHIIGMHTSGNTPNCLKEQMHTCANAMRDGKCVDPIMRNLAAMMYPEKYKNDREQR